MRIFQLATMALALSASFGPITHAHESAEDEETPISPVRTYNNPNIKHFAYEYVIDKETFPAYPLIVRAMQPALKGTSADLSLEHSYNPSLNVAQFDLNGDASPEIIAVPIENTEDGNYCGGDYHQCPHYIIDTAKDKPVTIGAIRAFAIDRGDDIKNGYWTLKVFTDSRLPENAPHIDIYAYDKKQKTYVRELEP